MITDDTNRQDTDCDFARARLDTHATDSPRRPFEGESQPVLKALRAHGINVVAIHGENPRVIFLLYWGVVPAANC
jgi:hypothetical protein